MTALHLNHKASGRGFWGDECRTGEMFLERVFYGKQEKGG